MNEKLISIITPMYNGEKFVEQTIESVLNQTYRSWEMIIIDDGSKDNSPEIVKEYAKKDSRILFYSQSNKGSSAARNKGLAYAKGEYICFLDSDDLWDNEFLEIQVQFIEKINAQIVFGSYRRVNEKNIEILKPFIVPSKVSYEDLLKTCSLSCLTTFFRKEPFKDIRFNEKLKSLRDDHAFWLDILKRVDFAYGNERVIASYRIFGRSTTANKRKVIKPQFMIYYKIEDLGFVKSVYYLAHWALNGFIKYR